MKKANQPLSPFLPGTRIQYAWDSTSIGYIKTCPRLYQYIMLDGWTPKEDSVHLRFGQEYHKALEEYDGAKISGQNHEESVRSSILNLLHRIHDWNPDVSTRAGNYKNPRTLIQLVLDYLDKYRDDPAQTIIREDGSAATEVSFRFELDWGPEAGYQPTPIMMNAEGLEEPIDIRPGRITYVDKGSSIELKPVQGQPYILCGHLDRVVTFNDQIMVMDHKTTTTAAGSYYMNQWSPNNQMSLYTLAGQVVLGGVIKGVIISAAQILLDKPNAFERGFTFRTPAQTEEWIQDLRIHLHMAEQYATINYWPQNDTACDKFGGCKFRGVCSKDPSVREAFLKADFIKLPEEERWNPLKPR